MLKHKISLFIITKILYYDLLILHVYNSFLFLKYTDYYNLIIIMITHQIQTVPTKKND